jgi:hypothetical protein
MGDEIFQGISFEHCMNKEVTAFRRVSSLPITNMQFRQGKTHATFGVHYKRGDRDDLEGYFGDLGARAERRMKELHNCRHSRH